MSRVLVIHWKPEEAKQHAELLRKSGHKVEVGIAKEEASLKDLRANPPDAFVIDLNRMPSHGRAVATALRQRRSTRHVPIIFVEGDAEKVARIRELLPDATYTSWRQIRTTLRRAIKSAPEKPIVPDTMAAYAGAPLTKKLGIAARAKVVLLSAPSGFEKALMPLPEGAQVQNGNARKADVVLLFATSRADLMRRLKAAAALISERGRLWICWQKQSSGAKSDLTQVLVRKIGMDSGLVDFKICSIDDSWSGLCFSSRRGN